MALNLNGTTGIVTGNIGALQVTSDKLASGAARANFGTGAVLQVVQGVKTDVSTGLSSTSFVDIPGLSATITPSATNSKVLIVSSVWGSCRSNASLRILRDSTPVGVNTTSPMGNRRNGVGADFFVGGSDTGTVQTNLYLDSPSMNTAITYKIQYACNGVSFPFCVNSAYADADLTYVSRGISTVTLVEIAG